MLAIDPVQRLSIAEIKAHPWTNGPLASQEEVIQELARRKELIAEAAEHARQQKLLQKTQPSRFSVPS